MKLYAIPFTPNSSDSMLVAWVGTQAEAKTKRKELVKEHERFNVDDIVHVDVPTDKTGLLEFLNRSPGVRP